MNKSKINLTIEELKQFKYPNLMAEVQETTYSICTIADHMGLTPYRKEDDPEVWDKLTGKTEILTSESIRLAYLFGVSLEYLFSKELEVIKNKTAAYWRWFKERERVKKDIERFEKARRVGRALEEKPYLLKILEIASDLNDEQVKEFTKMLEKRKVGKTV